MNQFLQFLSQYWSVILSAILSILTFLVFLLKKKPSSNLFQEKMTEVIKSIPLYISLAEKKYPEPSQGFTKLTFVLNLCQKTFAKLLGRELTFDEVNYVGDIFSKQIENILSAPQKKGESTDV